MALLIHILLILNIVYNCLSEEIQKLNVEKSPLLPGININAPVDNVLGLISTFLEQNNLDPAQLPNIEEDFEVTGLLLTHHGRIRLTHGWLQDVKTVERDGNAMLNMKLTRWDFVIPIGLFKVEFGYDYSVKLGLLGRSGGIIGDVTDFQMTIYAVFNLAQRQITDLRTDVTDIGDIHVELTGRPWNDWWMNAFIDAATTLIHNEIVSVINATANFIAQQVIDEINNHLPLRLYNNVTNEHSIIRENS